MNVAVIPAKGKSNRFEGKNLARIGEHSLLWWTIFYARCNTLIHNVVVSTEDDRIKREATSANCMTIDRPLDLCGEQPLLDTYTHAYYHLTTSNGMKIDNLIGLQCDNVDRNIRLDDELRKMKEKKYDMMFSISSDGKPNGAAKIYSSSILTHGRPYNLGVMIDDCTNIHYETDMANAIVRIGRTWWYNERYDRQTLA